MRSVRQLFRMRVVVAAVLAFGGLIATGSASAASTTTVSITSRLEPASVTVTVGDTVVWRNDDRSRHRIESTSGPAEFESDDLDPGATFAVNFTGTGTYRYVDHRNDDDPAYWGTITVVPPGGGPSGPGGAAPPPAGSPAPPSSAQVGMADRTFSPGSVTIAAGGSVQWTNNDDDSHTVSAGAFDSGIMSAGRSFSHTFPAAGSFSYLCQIHPDMRGTVSVVAPGGSSPPPSPPPSSAPAPSAPAPSGGTAAPAPSPGPAATAREVAMIDLDYSPRAVAAAAGDTITWVNRGSAIHTATADSAAFDSGIVSPGGRFTFRATTPGTFAYGCTVHPGMRGTVTVAGRGSPSPAVVAPAAKGAATGAPSPTAAAPAPQASEPSADPGPSSASVAIVDLEFSPVRVRVAAGGEVTWTNRGAAPHSATARDQSFDSGILAPQGTFSLRFDASGTYEYICLVHPDMVGVVEVGTVIAGVVQDTSGSPLVPAEPTAGGEAGSESAAGPPDGATALEATGVAVSRGGDRQMMWVPIFTVALLVAALVWAGFGPPISTGQRGAP